MTSQPLTYEDKLQRLQRQIEGSLDDTWKKYLINNRLDILLTVSYIALSTTVTLLSFFGKAEMAGVVGAILTALLSLQKIFNLDEKASFYRGFHMKTKDLRDRITYKVGTEEELQIVVDSFMELRSDRISSSPRRKGLDNQ